MLSVLSLCLSFIPKRFKAYLHLSTSAALLSSWSCFTDKSIFSDKFVLKEGNINTNKYTQMYVQYVGTCVRMEKLYKRRWRMFSKKDCNCGFNKLLRNVWYSWETNLFDKKLWLFHSLKNEDALIAATTKINRQDSQDVHDKALFIK